MNCVADLCVVNNMALRHAVLIGLLAGGQSHAVEESKHITLTPACERTPVFEYLFI